jgi:hypothetical protein
MFWRDHAPPHFHALYAEHEALIKIQTLEDIEGSLTRRALAIEAMEGPALLRNSGLPSCRIYDAFRTAHSAPRDLVNEDVGMSGSRGSSASRHEASCGITRWRLRAA